jgi:hypothetical protein
MTPAKRRSIYQRGQTGSKGNWLGTQNAQAALSRIGVRGLREPSSRPPLERISDPQISDEAKRKAKAPATVGGLLLCSLAGAESPAATSVTIK